MDSVVTYLTSVDWKTVFVPDTPVLEIAVRMSVVYLALYFLLRVVLKRESGTLATTDLLVVVLLADATQNAMAGDYKSISDGLLMAVVLVFWSWFLSYVAFRFPSVRHKIRPEPLLLMREGQILWSNARKELLTEGELLSQARLQGVASLEDVAYMFMETDGRISVIQKDKRQHEASPEKGGV